MNIEKIEHLVAADEDINMQAVRVLMGSEDEHLVVLAEFGGPRVTDVDNLKSRIQQKITKAGWRGEITIEVLRAGWLSNSEGPLNAVESAAKHVQMVTRRADTEQIFNSTFEMNITEEEKDTFGYFGSFSKIRTPTSIAHPKLIHIGNWVSLGRFGKIFMQTSFAELKEYLAQHYPSVAYNIPEKIWMPRCPRLKIADGATIGDFFFINCNRDIEIGIHAGIADRVYISDGNHLHNNPDLPPALMPNEMGKPIKIGDHTWLGVNTVILNGATVGKHSIVSSNSVVTRDVPDHCLAVGNPAKVVPLNAFGFNQRCAS
ncbi:MAG: acyltransferase [Prosthecobacter sp.]|uniref:acyltransferase n=1 Tax=Prosthecobacter sp. TaxID=1965333 RepID=UPI0038FDEF57